MKPKFFTFLTLTLAVLLLLTSCTNPTELPASDVGASSEAETTDAPTESATESETVSIFEETIPWYFEWKYYPLSRNEFEVPEEMQYLAFKTPVTYTEKKNGFLFEINFFREYYPIGQQLQVSVTLTNQKETPYPVFRGEGAYLRSDNSNILSNSVYLCGECPNSTVCYDVASLHIKNLAPGESIRYDYVFDLDPAKLLVEESYVFDYHHIFTEINFYSVTCPLEIVDLSPDSARVTP